MLLLKHIEGTFGSDDGAFHKILLASMHSYASQIQAKFLHIFYKPNFKHLQSCSIIKFMKNK